MKNTLLTIAVLLSGLTSHALSIDMTPVLATVSGYENGIEHVVLLADGRLQVVYANVDRAEKVKTLRLTSAVLNRLRNAVINLSNVEVKVSNSLVVCKMISMPKLSDLKLANYDHNTQTFSRDLKLILTAQSCDIGNKVSPVDALMKSAAQQLREQIVILALNLK